MIEKYQDGPAPRPEEMSSEVIISPDTYREERIPPGQARTRKWPVLHASYVPQIPTSEWSLEIRGLVSNTLRFNWEEFQNLPRVKVFADFHCVTRWSRLGNVWEGVSVREVLHLAGVSDKARYAIVHAYDNGWTTNLPLEELLQADTLFADTHDGEPLSADHGGPVRLIVPQLYAWKSAKWVRAVVLSSIDQPGFWESMGYHNNGNPWLEERHSWG